jgi:ATP-dependent exoDNAse (exonuclease V) alpha subunit
MNAEQEAFYDMVVNLGNPIYEQREIIVLNAPGGTGKTFTIKRILETRKDIAVLAPTHKAASLFHKERINAQTVHKFLKAEKEIDENTGELYFVFNRENTDTDIIIVDEASMVSQEMLEKLLNLKSHLVFVGDRCQIPPIGEKLSPVFSISDAAHFSFKINMRVRNNPDSISANYLAKFREGVDKPGSKIRVEKKNHEFLFEAFQDEKDTVLLSWTNLQVHVWNRKIRSRIFNQKEDELDVAYVGEKFIFSGYRADDSGNIYYSSDEVIVKEINRKVINLEYQTGMCKHQTPRTESQKTRILKCEDCDITGRSVKSHAIEYFEMTDQNNVKWLMPRKGIKQLKEIISDFKRHCKKMKSKSLWYEWYNFKGEYNPDLNYSYSMTVHKAQGSQWKYVFVNIDNIRFNDKPEERVRMEYTAVSRYSNMLFFI